MRDGGQGTKSELGTNCSQVPINDHSIPQTYKVPGPPVWTGSGAAKARSFTA
jgi:hypothetical protein